MSEERVRNSNILECCTCTRENIDLEIVGEIEKDNK